MTGKFILVQSFRGLRPGNISLNSRFQRIQTMTFSLTKSRQNLMAAEACKGGSHQDGQETESKEIRAQEKILPKTHQHYLTSKVVTNWEPRVHHIALGGN